MEKKNAKTFHLWLDQKLLLISRFKFLRILLIFALFFFALFAHLYHLNVWHHNESFYYKGKPILSSIDGYYYLRLTRDLLEDNYEKHDALSPIGVRPSIPPLLSFLTFFIAKISSFSIERIAFFLPSFLSLFMLIPYYFWGQKLGGFWFFVVSASLGMTSFYWCFRTGLGRYDTDSLLPFFVYLGSFLSLNMTLASSFRKKIFLFSLLFFLGFLFQWWWKFGLLLMILVAFVPYFLSVFFWKSPLRHENFFKKSFLLLVFFLSVFFSFFYHFLPSSILKYFSILQSHLSFILNKQESSFPSVGQSIGELSSLSFKSFIECATGCSVFLIPLVVFGSLFLFHRKKIYFFFLLFASLPGFLGIWHLRFTIFSVPFFAILLASSLFYFQNFLRKKRKSEVTLPFLLFLALFILIFNKTLHVPSKPIFRKHELKLIEKSFVHAKQKGRDLFYWSWWDFGYIIQYYARVPTFVDNGSQSPLRVFITAYPFVTNETKIAKNWIKFFSFHGPEAFLHLQKKLNLNYQKTLEFLKDVFHYEDNRHFLAQKYPVLRDKNWWSYLFPTNKKTIVFFMPAQMFMTASWWYYYGSWNFEKQEGQKIKVLPLLPSDFILDTNKGLLSLNGQTIPLKLCFGFDNKQNRFTFINRYYEHYSNYYLFYRVYGALSFLFEQDFYLTHFVQSYLDLSSTEVVPFCGAFKVIW